MGASKDCPIDDHEFEPCGCSDPGCPYCSICKEQQCFHVRAGHSATVVQLHPLKCSKAHWGISDCEECGLTWDEQPDFPGVIPERYKIISG